MNFKTQYKLLFILFIFFICSCSTKKILEYKPIKRKVPLKTIEFNTSQLKSINLSVINEKLILLTEKHLDFFRKNTKANFRIIEYDEFYEVMINRHYKINKKGVKLHYSPGTAVTLIRFDKNLNIISTQTSA